MKAKFSIGENVWLDDLKCYDIVKEILIHIRSDNTSCVSYKLITESTWIPEDKVQKEKKTLTFEQFKDLIHKFEYSQTASVESLWNEIKNVPNAALIEQKSKHHLGLSVETVTIN